MCCVYDLWCETCATDSFFNVLLGGLYIISGVFPVWTLVLVLSVLVAIVVACTSRNDKPPVYHCVSLPLLHTLPSHFPLRVASSHSRHKHCTISPSSPQAFAWVGFVVSVVWIYCIANEIVNLLQVWRCHGNMYTYMYLLGDTYSLSHAHLLTHTHTHTLTHAHSHTRSLTHTHTHTHSLTHTCSLTHMLAHSPPYLLPFLPSPLPRHLAL